jgi:hypothetical protein
MLKSIVTIDKSFKELQGNYVMLKGRPLPDDPKTYKKLGVFNHTMTDLLSPKNNYNPSWCYVFKAKDKSLRYGVYRDGCFYAFYGKLEKLS